MKIAIIGTGPSGYSSGMEFLKKGFKVEFFDFNKNSKKKIPKIKNVSPKLNNQEYLNGNSIFYENYKIKKNKFILTSYLGIGGLSNFWGGGIEIPENEYLNKFYKKKVLKNEMKNVLNSFYPQELFQKKYNKFYDQDIVNNFLVAYVGDGKIIDHATKQDILFHSKRAIQEFSYDVSRVEKIFEVSIPTTLIVPMPQDYVNYVKLSWVDDNGLERRIYPTNNTSRPSQAVLQDTDSEYLYDNDNSLLLTEDEITKKFNGIETNAALGSSSSNDYFTANSDYSDSVIGYGRRYGSHPEHLQVNGVFVNDEANGQFGFSSNLSEKILTIHYISDGLGTDAEMQIHKMAEEALYKHVAYAILSSKQNVPEFIINRFRRERRAAMRNAKLRLSNIKLAEITAIMRNKSKQIKH